MHTRRVNKAIEHMWMIRKLKTQPKAKVTLHLYPPHPLPQVLQFACHPLRRGKKYIQTPEQRASVYYIALPANLACNEEVKLAVVTWLLIVVFQQLRQWMRLCPYENLLRALQFWARALYTHYHGYPSGCPDIRLFSSFSSCESSLCKQSC